MLGSKNNTMLEQRPVTIQKLSTMLIFLGITLKNINYKVTYCSFAPRTTDCNDILFAKR